MSEKLEMVKCHHKGCGHEWEPRVKRPKKCPVCQNPLWKSASPKKAKAAPTPTAVSEAVVPTPLTTVTSGKDIQSSDVSGVEPVTSYGQESETTLTPIYERVEVPPDADPDTVVQRLQREAEERLRRLADQPID